VGDTCHIDVIDRHGNMVAATPSGGWLSSSPTIPALGFALNTRLQMSWLDEGLPGSVEPRVAPCTTLSPSMALRDGEPYMAFGTPGGDQQDQWSVGFFLRHAVHGMNLQQAIDAPAWHVKHAPSSFWPRQTTLNTLTLESRFEPETLARCARWATACRSAMPGPKAACPPAAASAMPRPAGAARRRQSARHAGLRRGPLRPALFSFRSKDFITMFQRVLTGLLLLALTCTAQAGLRRLPREADHADRPLGRGRLHRHPGARHRRAAHQVDGPARGGRQPVGASGNIGSNFVAKAKPDGYTLLIGSMSTHAMNPTLMPGMPFNGTDDFTPIALVANVINTMVINPSVPAKNLREFIAYAKANPGKLAYASAGGGSTNHLSAEMFKKAAGIDMLHVPYKGGAPAVLDTVGNQTQVLFSAGTQTLPHVKAGKLRLLAVTEPKRSSLLPDTPTVAETLPGYEMSVWYAAFGPAGMPAELVTRLNTEINKALAVPEVRARMDAMGVELVKSTPEQLATSLRRDTQRYDKIIKDLGIKLD
jgi:tripartite-type tricarboxylate transporter receptor subunit TctC